MAATFSSKNSGSGLMKTLMPVVDVGKEFDQPKTEQTPSSMRGLNTVFWKFQNTVPNERTCLVVGQNHERKEGVDRNVRHGDQIEMNDLGNELLACVGK